MSASLSLHPALTHAQAIHVCREHGLEVRQDGRGNLRVERKAAVPSEPRGLDPEPTTPVAA